jgi:hypothetical protein
MFISLRIDKHFVFSMDAKIQKWKSLPATLSEFVCAVPLTAIECKALAGILPEQCPRIEQIQVRSEFVAQFFLIIFFALFNFTCSYL